MIFEIRSSIEIFKQAYDLIILLGFVILTVTGILILTFQDYIYISVTGIFLRISKITEINLLEFIFALFSFLIVIALYTLSLIILTVATKEYRADRIHPSVFIKNIISSFPEVYKIFIIWFLIQFNLSVLWYVNAWDPMLLSIIFFLISYIFLFIPYAIVIEEVDFDRAIKKLYIFRKELAIYPIMYSAIGLIINLILIFIFGLVFPLDIVRIMMLVINIFIIVPFLVILGANLYFNKFSLSIRKI
ncbi:MAG: hypothetical protein QXI75_00805 [Candidatus Anstonellales archaeon]